MKIKNRIVILLMAMLLLLNSTQVMAAQNTSVETVVSQYMNARVVSMISGDTLTLSEYAVEGILSDEGNHYNDLLDSNISVLDSIYEIITIDEFDTMIEVVLEELITYQIDNIIKKETIEHKITLMDNADTFIVVSDEYLEEYSGFVSASYVSDYVPYVFGSGSGNCVVTIAKSQIGYYEKATNSNLESFTANAGTGNYTKYGAWTGMNGEAWCASFVSWCANQAQVSESIVTKTASCDVSMNFFKNNGRFYASSAYGGSYRPKAGDIFFTGPNAYDATHTGIVVSISGTTITYVDGNGTGDVVKQRTMSWTNTSLLGFANPAYASSTHTWVNKTSYYQCSICGQTATSIPVLPAAFNINE